MEIKELLNKYSYFTEGKINDMEVYTQYIGGELIGSVGKQFINEKEDNKKIKQELTEGVMKILAEGNEDNLKYVEKQITIGLENIERAKTININLIRELLNKNFSYQLELINWQLFYNLFYRSQQIAMCQFNSKCEDKELLRQSLINHIISPEGVEFPFAKDIVMLIIKLEEDTKNGN